MPVLVDWKVYVPDEVDVMESETIGVLPCCSMRITNKTKITETGNRLEPPKIPAGHNQYRMHADCF